jgi:Hint module
MPTGPGPCSGHDARLLSDGRVADRVCREIGRNPSRKSQGFHLSVHVVPRHHLDSDTSAAAQSSFDLNVDPSRPLSSTHYSLFSSFAVKFRKAADLTSPQYCNMLSVAIFVLLLTTGAHGATCPTSLAGCAAIGFLGFSPKSSECTMNLLVTKAETQAGCCYYDAGGARAKFEEALKNPFGTFFALHQDELQQYNDVLCGRQTVPTGPSANLPAYPDGPSQDTSWGTTFGPCACGGGCTGTATTCLGCCASQGISAGIHAAAPQCELEICTRGQNTPSPVRTRPASTLAATKSAKSVSSCFPADATVELEGGAVVTIETLAVGDRVHVGNGQFSEVFMFTHEVADHAGEFV